MLAPCDVIAKLQGHSQSNGTEAQASTPAPHVKGPGVSLTSLESHRLFYFVTVNVLQLSCCTLSDC